MRRRSRTVTILATVVLAAAGAGPGVAAAAVANGSAASGQSGEAGGTLEAAAAKASTTGRTVAMSLIGLAFAVAATVLAFRRDFKEAAGVFAVGIVAVLLATPAGITVVKETVSSLFGAQ